MCNFLIQDTEGVRENGVVCVSEKVGVRESNGKMEQKEKRRSLTGGQLLSKGIRVMKET